MLDVRWLGGWLAFALAVVACVRDDGDDPCAAGACATSSDECANATHDCSPDATCSDTPEGFNCQCNAGFYGDGRYCMPEGSGSGAGGFPEEPCECDEYTHCHDGVVTYGGPCDFCPVEHMMCEKGCWDDSMLDPFPIEEICFEFHSHSPGDACGDDDDCLPTEAHLVSDHYVTLYLECDEAAGVCVEVPAPPEPADWLGPCDAALLDPILAADPAAQGYVYDPSCSAGVCLLLAYPSSCDIAGCLSLCEEDWDCPQGARCWTRHQAGGDQPYQGVCEPFHVSDELPCYAVDGS